MQWGMGEDCGGGREERRAEALLLFCGEQGPILGYITSGPTLPRREKGAWAPPLAIAPATFGAAAGPSPISIPLCCEAAERGPACAPAATCLHDAVALRDVLGDAGFIAALQKDGPVVIHIQDSDKHGSRACAPLAYGAIVCGR